VKLEEFLSFVVQSLDALEIPFMLTGSLAASYHGCPRATQDVDLVIDQGIDVLLDLAETLRDRGLYVSDDAVREAERIRGQFNAIDPSSGWKADFMIRKNRPFSIAEFNDRQSLRFLGLELSVARPEDLIVAKLEWAKLGDSERQIRDAAEILAVQGRALDMSRIDRWVEELQLEDQWAQVRFTDRKSESPNAQKDKEVRGE